MACHDYPAAADHKQEHVGLARQVVDLRRQLVCGQPVITDDLMRFLRAWLTDHSLGSDMALGSFLAAKPG
jgi:hemerythrin